MALGAWGGFRRRALNMLLGITGLGLGALGVGLAPAHAFPLALAGLLLAGAMDSLTVGSAFAWLQTQVPADLHGRVLSTVVSVTAAMMPLGMAVAGPFADRWGVRTWFLLAGGVQTLVGLAAWLAVAGGRFAEAPLDAAQAAEDGAPGGDAVVWAGAKIWPCSEPAARPMVGARHKKRRQRSTTAAATCLS